MKIDIWHKRTWGRQFSVCIKWICIHPSNWLFLRWNKVGSQILYASSEVMHSVRYASSEVFLYSFTAMNKSKSFSCPGMHVLEREGRKPSICWRVNYLERGVLEQRKCLRCYSIFNPAPNRHMRPRRTIYVTTKLCKNLEFDIVALTESRDRVSQKRTAHNQRAKNSERKLQPMSFWEKEHRINV